jgi:hypothetical protein
MGENCFAQSCHPVDSYIYKCIFLRTDYLSKNVFSDGKRVSGKQALDAAVDPQPHGQPGRPRYHVVFAQQNEQVPTQRTSLLFKTVFAIVHLEFWLLLLFWSAVFTEWIGL